MKYITVAAFTFLLISTAQPVMAMHPSVDISSETGVSTDHPDVRTDVGVRIEAKTQRGEALEDDRRETLLEHRTEAKARIASSTGSRIEVHLATFTRLVRAAIDRMERFIARIEARADLMDAEGYTTTEARGFLEVAEGELADAEADLVSIKADFDASLSTSVSGGQEALRALFADTKEALASAKAHLRAAHQAVRDAVASLKAQIRLEAEVETSAE